MANQADVFIKNKFKPEHSFKFKHLLPNGSVNSEGTLPVTEEEKFFLPDTQSKIIVDPPPGFNIKDCWFSVKGMVDLNIVYSRTDNNWTINIIPNDLPPDVPTTVNVTMGGEAP